jgi:regulator of PEP synthase PpsR (kinase-PPPase family)
MSGQGWRTLDVSYLAVEEIAREVMRMRGLSEHTLG